MIALLLQIGELFDGKFNWGGVFHLFMFILMAVIIVSFGVWIGYKAFISGKSSKK